MIGQFLAIMLLGLAFVAQDTPDLPSGMSFDIDGTRIYQGPTDYMPVLSDGKCPDAFVILNSGGGTWNGSFASLSQFFICSETVVYISGSCASACTLLLTLPPERVCVEPDAVLGFHGPYTPYTMEELLVMEGIEVTEENLEYREEQYRAEQSRLRASMRRVLPSWLRPWLDETGALELEGANILRMNGVMYSALPPATACTPD